MTWNFRPKQLETYKTGGFELLPLNKPDALDEKGRSIGKAPLNKGWRRVPALTIDQAVQLMTEEEHNVGVRLRDTDLVIDVDPRNFAEGEDPLKRLQDDLGIDLSGAPTVITGSGGKHIYLRKPAEVAVRDSLDAYQGVEFKSLGRQVVAAGSVHPVTLQPYTMDELSDSLQERPEAPHSLLEVIKRPGRMGGAESGKYRPEQIEEALTFLNAQADFGKGQYERWLQLMMSCHHATGGEGRAEFLAWCATDPEYSDKSAEVGRKWDGFHTEGSRVVSYKHLFGLLGKFGGEDGKNFVRRVDKVPAEEDFPNYLDADDRTDLDEIIASLPEGNRGVNEAMEWFNKAGFCAVMDGSAGFRVMRQVEDTEWSFLSSDGKVDKPRMRWDSYKRTDFLNFYETKKCESADGKKTVQVAAEWLGWGQRTSYEGVVFDPAGRYRGGKYLNLWTDWAVQPRKGNCSLLYQLLLEALCNGNVEAFEYNLNWAAFMVQNPDKPAEVAVVFRGSKGVGKGTWGRALAMLCGRHSLQISNQLQFTNHFNAHMRDCIFLFADEAMWAGDKKSEGELKRLITESTLAIEAKGKDIIQARNMLHVMMASNEEWVVPAGLDDERRFAVFEVNDRFKGQHEFFQALNDQLDNGGLQALLWDLKTRDISKFHPRRQVPKTGALARQKIATMDFLDGWYYNCLLNRSFGRDIAPIAGHWESHKGIRILSCDLQTSVELYLQKIGDRWSRGGRRSMMTTIGERLKKRVPSARHVRFTAPKDRALELGEWLNTDGRTYGYDLPGIEECRILFEGQIGERLDWDNAAEDGDVEPVMAEIADEFDPLA
jgi:hypothetical protein